MTGAPASGFGVPDGPRPPTRLIGVAAGFVHAVAALAVVWAVVGLIGASGLADALAADPDTSTGAATAGRLSVQVWVTLASAALVALMFAGAAAASARALTRGSAMGYWWCVGLVGLHLAVVVFGAATEGVQQHLLAFTAETPDFSADLDDVAAALPDWYATYTVAHNAVGVLVGTVTLVLLFLPASVEHSAHRPRPGGFEVPR